MITITVRGVDDTIHDRLVARAARNGRSMEAELRAILNEVFADEAECTLRSLNVNTAMLEDCSTSEFLPSSGPIL